MEYFILSCVGPKGILPVFFLTFFVLKNAVFLRVPISLNYQDLYEGLFFIFGWRESVLTAALIGGAKKNVLRTVPSLAK